MTAFSKISLGRNSKKYSHNMSFDNNTSFPFGVVQPLMCQPMLADSSISVSYRQLLRLAPMPVPTFGRVSLRSEAFFVPITDVCPYYEAMLAQKSYPGSNGSLEYYPTTVPVTNNAMLVTWMMFNCCYFSVYNYDNTLEYFQPTVPTSSSEPAVDQLLSLSNEIVKKLGVTRASTSPLGSLNLHFFTYDYATPEGADFVIQLNSVFDDDKTKGTLVCFKLNNFGRRLRANLIGCGYSLNIADTSLISLLPLLSYYKAWFDYYEVKREKQWLSTSCYKLITNYTENYITDFSHVMFSKTPTQRYVVLFNQFMQELGNTWYVEDVNYVSAHRDGLVTQEGSVRFISNVYESNMLENKSGNDLPTLSGADLPDSISLVTLQALSRLTRFLNKDSVIGGKLNDWIRNHYGADISNSLYRNSNHIGSYRLDSDISEVISTSDTADTDKGTGEYLGSYAGKGIGFDKNGFHFKCSTFGYVFFVSAIVPHSRFFQGNDPTLYSTNVDTIPIPDYDALGYELTPKMSIFGDNGYQSYMSTLPSSDESFGYIPRYSGWKQRKDVINGDMSRRGVLASTSAYYLDRIIVQNLVDSSPVFARDQEQEFVNGYTFEVTTQNPPSASIEWRYPTRYSWLGNYNRIFYNSGALSNEFTKKYGDSEPLDDNFYAQTVFDVKVTNFLKPVSLSYDTFCEEIDNSSHDTNQD